MMMMIKNMEKGKTDDISRQTKIFVYSKNRIFLKKPVFLKILCPKIYGTLLIYKSQTAQPHWHHRQGL